MIFDLNQVLWLVKYHQLTELLEVLECYGYKEDAAIAFLRRFQLEFIVD